MLGSLPQSLNDPGTPSLSWDKVCDLLGGADWSTIPEPIQSLPPFRASFSAGRQFLFQDDPERLPLESLWLKLSAFASLCRRVSECYHQHQRPYLTLDPEHVTARVSSHAFTRLPARWQFAVELDMSKAAMPLVHETMPSEMARNIFVPLANLDAAYAAPIMRQWPMGRVLPVTILLRSVERMPDDTDEQALRGLVRAHVLSDVASFADSSERDVFHLTLKPSGGAHALVSLWARRVEEAERGVVVSGVIESIPPATWAQLERAKQQVFSDARAAVYRAFHHACDLYSLGMLLLRALLVNQHGSLQQVQQQVTRVLDGLEPLVQGLHPDDHWTLFTRVSGRLKEQHVIFNPPAADAIPEYLWYDALILGLRLVSWIPGFSFCDSAGATDEQPVPEAVRSAVRAADHMAERARIELFDASARHHEFMRMCDRVLAERL